MLLSKFDMINNLADGSGRYYTMLVFGVVLILAFIVWSVSFLSLFLNSGKNNLQKMYGDESVAEKEKEQNTNRLFVIHIIVGVIILVCGILYFCFF